jgi:hypothetical protein
MATEFQLKEARRRQQLVEDAKKFPSLQTAAKELGEPAANLCRYRQKYDGTLESLMPATDNAGRPRLAACLSDDEIAFAKQRYLMTESLPLAIEALADSPICSAGSRAFLDRYRDSRDYPPSLYQALRVPEEIWAEYRGKKQAQGTQFVSRRGMFMIDEAGHRREVVSGDIFEEDDVSVDVPYAVPMPDGTFSVGRQVLMCRDARSGQYKGACAVARDRDSYRAEDIVRFNRWLVESHGLPGRFRFERGSWQSEMIQGIKLPDGRRWGGLKQLVPIDPCFSSNGKGGIEASMRMWHKVLGLHGVRIGKTRGEYEEPTADMMAVNEGRKHPDECGFMPWSKVLAAFEAAGKLINGRAHYDRHSGEHIAPDDVWWRDMQARHGKRLPACPGDYFYHFLPTKRIVGVGTTYAGHVQVTVDGYRQPFLFRCAGMDGEGKPFPFLERKHQVIVCFDPHEAAAGAQIFNIDASARNREGFRPLQRLFTAPLAEDRPQVDLSSSDRGADAHVQAKKIRATQVKAAFTSIGNFGHGARRVHHAHDGKGNAATIATGAPAASSLQTPREAVAQVVRAPRKAAAHVEDLSLDAEDMTSGEMTPPGIVNRVASFSHAQPADHALRRSAAVIEDLDLR